MSLSIIKDSRDFGSERSMYDRSFRQLKRYFHHEERKICVGLGDITVATRDSTCGVFLVMEERKFYKVFHNSHAIAMNTNVLRERVPNFIRNILTYWHMYITKPSKIQTYLWSCSDPYVEMVCMPQTCNFLTKKSPQGAMKRINALNELCIVETNAYGMIGRRFAA